MQVMHLSGGKVIILLLFSKCCILPTITFPRSFQMQDYKFRLHKHRLLNEQNSLVCNNLSKVKRWRTHYYGGVLADFFFAVRRKRARFNSTI